MHQGTRYYRQSAALPSFHAWIGRLNLRGRRADVAAASYKTASLDVAHSPWRVKTFCGAIAGIARICGTDLSAGEPRGRFLRETGTGDDFEMRCVACTVSLVFGFAGRSRFWAGRDGAIRDARVGTALCRRGQETISAPMAARGVPQPMRVGVRPRSPEIWAQPTRQ